MPEDDTNNTLDLTKTQSTQKPVRRYVLNRTITGLIVRRTAWKFIWTQGR